MKTEPKLTPVNEETLALHFLSIDSSLGLRFLLVFLALLLVLLEPVKLHGTLVVPVDAVHEPLPLDDGDCLAALDEGCLDWTRGGMQLLVKLIVDLRISG